MGSEIIAHHLTKLFQQLFTIDGACIRNCCFIEIEPCRRWKKPGCVGRLHAALETVAAGNGSSVAVHFLSV